MLLKQPIQNVFVQLTETLNQLSADEYIQPSKTLFNASIGQHVRHIIELFLCLEKGYESGVVNYEKRKRDYQIETNKDLANPVTERYLPSPGTSKYRPGYGSGRL